MGKLNAFEDTLCKALHDIDANKEFINGNGKPGAKTQLALIQQAQKQIINSQRLLFGLNGSIFIALLVDIFTSHVP